MTVKRENQRRNRRKENWIRKNQHRLAPKRVPPIKTVERKHVSSDTLIVQTGLKNNSLNRNLR